MKRSILITLVIVTLIAGNNFAQTKAFRFGFKLAPNLGWITPNTEGYESTGTVPGFSWGFVSDFALTDNYFLKTGFGMDFLNGKLDYPHEMDIEDDLEIEDLREGTLSRKYKLRYLDIPLMIKMRTNQFGNIAYFGEIGLNNSFRLNAKAKDKFTYGSNFKEGEPDLKEEVVFFKEALVFSAGIEYNIDESTSLTGGLTFSNGLTDMLQGQNTINITLDQKARIHYFALVLGVMF